MTKIARASTQPRPCIESWNACAVPWKLPDTVPGSVSRAASCTRATASPSATPGRRLNDSVTDGSCPVWLTDSGPDGLARGHDRGERHQLVAGRRARRASTARPGRAGTAARPAGSPGTGRRARRSATPAATRTRSCSASCTWSTVRPSAAIWSRSRSTLTCGFRSCRSDVTSSMPSTLAQRGLELRRRPVQLVGVGVLQRELVLAARHHAADADGRRVGQEDADARDARELRPQFLDHLVRRQRPLVARLQVDVQAAAPIRTRWRCSRRRSGRSPGRSSPPASARRSPRSRALQRFDLALQLAGVHVGDESHRDDPEQLARSRPAAAATRTSSTALKRIVWRSVHE